MVMQKSSLSDLFRIQRQQHFLQIWREEMPKPLKHIDELHTYLKTGDETKHRDLVTQFFRKVAKKKFSPEKGTDGYIAGKVIVEIKGDESDWFAGYFQGIAYWKNKDLECTLITVITKNQILIWDIDSIPKSHIKAVEELRTKKCPCDIGKKLAKELKDEKNKILILKTWRLNITEILEIFVYEKLKQYEQIIKECKFTRLKITIDNFTEIVKMMTFYFEIPMDAVKSFYLMINLWDRQSKIKIPNTDRLRKSVIFECNDTAEVLEGVKAGQREELKDFCETYYISDNDRYNIDDFFSKYDKAVFAVDPEYTKMHGVVFTPPNLAMFSMFMVKSHFGNTFGDNYLIIDPAAGSGNLISNWKSPLKMRYKVISEIEPYFLNAIENRLKIDAFHYGKYTVVPKVEDGKGLNFLDIDAKSYLKEVTKFIPKGEDLNKPLAFLCNPPYRNSDDQGAANVSYTIHKSITDIVGINATSERYLCFLAQMNMICAEAEKGGRRSDSVMMLFTPTGWLNNRDASNQTREKILKHYEFIDGFMITANKFFDSKLTGRWPLAFTIWKYKGQNANLNTNRNIALKDLSALTKNDLENLSIFKYKNIMKDVSEVPMGITRTPIKEWSGQARQNLYRAKTQEERNDSDFVSGMPKGDHRHTRVEPLGYWNGENIGFLDDLTPCRNKKEPRNKPWFYLDNRFHQVNKTRCFSGTPSHYSYCAKDPQIAKKLFIWFALGKTFQLEYPLWANAMEIWEPEYTDDQFNTLLHYSFAIGYADNECIEAWFPRDNPKIGATPISILNPLSHLNKDSFWNTEMKPFLKDCKIKSVTSLIKSVNKIYSLWATIINQKNPKEIKVKYTKPYFLEEQARLTINAGLIQIRDYASAYQHEELKLALAEMAVLLKSVKQEFYMFLTDKNEINYFGIPSIRTTRKRGRRISGDNPDTVEQEAIAAIKRIKKKKIKSS
jgi:hypothetical protein